MNSHQRSIGNVFLACLLGLGVCACSAPSARTPERKENLTSEVSLSEDRSQLSELRKEIHPELQKENDELALILKLFGAVKDQPSTVREKWSNEVRKRRERFDKILRRERETYSRAEQKNRDGFLKGLEKERENFGRAKHTSQDRSEFFSELDQKRRDYFAGEREKREDFESTIRERRKEFDDYIKERQGVFEVEYRDYTKRYQEFQTQLEKEKKEKQATKLTTGQGIDEMQPGREGATTRPRPTSDPDLELYRIVPKSPAISLKADETE